MFEVYICIICMYMRANAHAACCLHAGVDARSRLVKLKKQCPDRPTVTGRRVLKRIAKNKLPYGLKRWPDEERA